jgi:hypothetical protein
MMKPRRSAPQPGRSLTAQAMLRGIGLVLLFGTLLLGVVSYFNYAPPEGPPSVTVLANQGDYALVLRTPPAPDGTADDMLVAAPDAPAAPSRVVRGPAGRAADSPIGTATLAPEVWQPLDTLRANWCTASPLFLGLRNDEPMYDVALRCGLAVRRVRVPADSLPPELDALRAAVPPAP